MKNQLSFSGEENGIPRLKIQGGLTVSSVMELWDVLKTCLDENQLPVLDLSEVDEYDSVGIQLLLAARKSATATGIPFHLSGTGETFDHACQEIGLSPQALTVMDGGRL